MSNMTGFNKILVCVDGSKGSEQAARKAAEIAKAFGSTISLMTVWEPPNVAGRGPVPKIVPDLALERVEGAKRILDKEGIEYQMVTVIGHPAKSIIDESENGYDLVVMGSRGLGGVESFLLGSVTSRVAHHLKTGLMIVPG